MSDSRSPWERVRAWLGIGASKPKPLYYSGGPEHGKRIIHPLTNRPLEEHEILPDEIGDRATDVGVYVWKDETQRYEWEECKR